MKAAKPDRRLKRHLQQIERMPAREMCHVPQLTHCFIECEQVQSAKD